MDQRTGEGTTLDERTGALERSLRIALAVYLSPLILLVMGIGLVGAMATRLTASTHRGKGQVARAAHAPARPMAIGSVAKKSRQSV